VNGNAVKANYKVQPGDQVTVTVPEPEALDVTG
jgi:23S rRNA pseudouridine1911/1915/1917 synthase